MKDEYAEALRARSRNGPPRLDPGSIEYEQERREFQQTQKEFKEGKRARKPEWSDVILKDYMTTCQGDNYCLTFQCGNWRPVELVHPLGYFGLSASVVTRGHVRELTEEKRRLCDCVLLSFVYARETSGLTADPDILPAYSRRNFDLTKFWWDLREKLDTPAGEGMIQRAWVRIEAFLRRQGQAGVDKIRLTDTEKNILEALGREHMTGPVLLKKAGYDYSSHYRQILSYLVKQGILGNDQTGYFRRDT